MKSRIDKFVLVCAVLLTIIGLVAIYSTTSKGLESGNHATFYRQLIWIGIGILGGIVATFISFKFMYTISYVVYAFAILGLITVLFFGKGSGADRWLNFGFMQLQPSELAKIGTILALARYLQSDRTDLTRLSVVVTCFGIVFLPIVLILRQPDMGTALVFAGLILPILYWAGLPKVTLFLISAPVVTCICAFNYYTFLIAIITITAILYFSRCGRKAIIFNFLLNVAVGILSPLLWNRLEPYQQKRILTFIGLESDPQGIGYQVIQSKVAIGSGGLFGKGFMAGTQTQLRFLPEQHTDFIFSVIGEEFGFVGALIVLTLFLVLILRALQIAASVRNKYTSIVVIGSVITIVLHVLINIGVTVGIMPVTGLPLPFISYGGSAFLTFSCFIGFILNASINKLEY